MLEIKNEFSLIYKGKSIFIIIVNIICEPFEKIIKIIFVSRFREFFFTMEIMEYLTLKGHEHSVNSLVFSPDCKYIITGSSDKTVKVWELSTGACIHTLKGHAEVVVSVEVIPDNNFILSGSDDKTIKVWDLSTMTYIRTSNINFLYNFVISPNYKYLATYKSDKTIIIYELATEEVVQTIKAERRGFVCSFAFSPDSEYLAIITDSSDYTAEVWDLNLGVCIFPLKGHTDILESVAFSPNGKHLVTGSFDNTIKVWNMSTGSLLRTLRGHTESINAVTFSPDGKFILSGSFDKTVKLWDFNSGTLIRTLRGHKNFITSVGFSPNHKYIASTSADKTVKIWRVITPDERKEIEYEANYGLFKKNILEYIKPYEEILFLDIADHFKINVKDVETEMKTMLKNGNLKGKLFSGGLILRDPFYKVDPIEILKVRLAKGEISEDEFIQKKKLLKS